MISVAEAERLLKTLPVPQGVETVPLTQAVGRVLAEPLIADRDGPPFDRVAMDGYAVRSTEGNRKWSIAGFQAAGRPALPPGPPGTAVEVATGAMVPQGYDAVIPYEETHREAGIVTLVPRHATPSAGVQVHRRGSDFLRGATLLPAGTRLRSPHLHALATGGVDPVTVVRRLSWALVATGDELVGIRERPEAWQIRRSNAAAIAGEASAWGLFPSRETVLPDDQGRLRQGLEPLVASVDVVVLTGGVSAGALDLVPGVLADLGAQTLFHKIAQRPGKPLWCGTLPRGSGETVVVFGLPGNPVSSLFGFRRYVLPWLLAAEGSPPRVERVPASGLQAPPPGYTVFLPWSEVGPLNWKGSGDFAALGASSGFIEVDDHPESLVEPLYYPWGGSR